jgi:dissimilatory sulfite reductase (desulfoviridin) alpha/beta subunit
MAELQSIDYDALKKRGFLRQKQDGFFVLRLRMSCANYESVHLERAAEIARRYARGYIHVTTRQGIEIPFILYKDIDEAEKAVHEVGMGTGTSGPRLRATTCCPGNNWCKQGLVDTFKLNNRIEEELGLRCSMDLPHKFKIALSGCPNACTRAQHSEIGIHGQIDVSGGQRRIGYTVYLAGCGGRTPRPGLKLDKIFDEDGVLAVVDKVVRFYKENVMARQRLAVVVEQMGQDVFLKSAGLL